MYVCTRAVLARLTSSRLRLIWLRHRPAPLRSSSLLSALVYDLIWSGGDLEKTAPYCLSPLFPCMWQVLCLRAPRVADCCRDLKPAPGIYSFVKHLTERHVFSHWVFSPHDGRCDATNWWVIKQSLKSEGNVWSSICICIYTRRVCYFRQLFARVFKRKGTRPFHRGYFCPTKLKRVPSRHRD